MNNRLIQTLQIKSFLSLWLAEIFSQIAMNMMNFILLVVAFSLTNSNTAVSGIVLAFTVPAIIFGILAGAYVDRWDKKKVLWVTNIIRAVLVTLLAISHTNLVIVYLLTFVIAVVTQFFIPAETPIIPLLVKKELLLTANALFGIALYGSVLVAYALSGPFLLLFGSTNALLFLAACFVIAALFVTGIRIPKQTKASPMSTLGKKISLMSEVRVALRAIVSIKEILDSFFLLSMSQIIILLIAVIGPGYAKNVLGIPIAEFPLIFITPAALGMGMGALLLTNVLHSHEKRKTTTIGIMLSALALLFLPYGEKISTLAFVLGFANALVFVPSNTIIQEKTSEQLRGKIYGALNAAASVLSLFPVIMVGSLADMFGERAILTGVGVFVGIFAIIRMIL